jgi:myosin heavy subunit
MLHHESRLEQLMKQRDQQKALAATQNANLKLKETQLRELEQKLEDLQELEENAKEEQELDTMTKDMLLEKLNKPSKFEMFRSMNNVGEFTNEELFEEFMQDQEFRKKVETLQQQSTELKLMEEKLASLKQMKSAIKANEESKSNFIASKLNSTDQKSELVKITEAMMSYLDEIENLNLESTSDEKYETDQKVLEDLMQKLNRANIDNPGSLEVDQPNSINEMVPGSLAVDQLKSMNEIEVEQHVVRPMRAVEELVIPKSYVVERVPEVKGCPCPDDSDAVPRTSTSPVTSTKATVGTSTCPVTSAKSTATKTGEKSTLGYGCQMTSFRSNSNVEIEEITEAVPEFKPKFFADMKAGHPPDVEEIITVPDNDFEETKSKIDSAIFVF